MNQVQAQIGAALAATDPLDKVRRVQALVAPSATELTHWEIVTVPRSPGRPTRLRLVAPRELPRRRALGTPKGRFALLHALAHIEFNAINLALDAAYAFAGMPPGFYSDWLQVAREEALHFSLLSQRLEDLGGCYGDLPAHDGLWEAARATADDAMARMALVPRVLEARGLDVTPALRQRLQTVGDAQSAAILERIEADERGHVAIGSRWFTYLARRAGVDPEATFFTLLDRHYRGRILGPLAREARLQAGFSVRELDLLEARAVRPEEQRGDG
ncbi:MAG: ferritin-like domain-containing protein [Acidithiobacillus sp.]|uniref:ferritin-like domain-containing protein n=1 Tax=Acidithiobacillus sp. TaxID=1872118 RepID=UPI003D00F0F7